jgi:medium-chain acyl-[acyl-carrier-protein] hydrolase
MGTLAPPLRLVHHGNQEGVRLRLFCFPYAGGSSVLFRDWPNYLAASVDICTIEVAGRERLLAGQRTETFAQLLARVGEILNEQVDRPYAMFGYSMGALVSYLLARSQCERGLRPPSALLVAAHRAPHLPRRRDCLHNLSDAELIEALIELRGTPFEVLENREVMELYLPSVRSDLRFSETYQHESGERLPCPIYAFGGLADNEVSEDEIAAWQVLTAGAFRLEMIQGNHFFLHQTPDHLLAGVNTALSEIATLGTG